MAVRKLKGFEQWSHLGFDGKLIFRKPLDIPFVTYSNHMPCYEANAYIHKLIVRNLKSDTIRGYAHDIIHLVRIPEQSSHRFRDSPDTHSVLIRTLFPA